MLVLKLSIFLIVLIGLIETQSQVNALWRWKDDLNHYLINEMNTVDWFEVQNGQVIFKYVLWDVDHSFSKEPIIYDDSRKIFVEIFDNSWIYAFNDASNLNHGDIGAFGGWAIKPGFENPIVPLPSVEVYLLPIMNRVGRPGLFNSFFRGGRRNIGRNTNVGNNVVSVNNVINNNDNNHHDHMNNIQENDITKGKERISESRKDLRENEISPKEKPKAPIPIEKQEHRLERKSPNKPAKKPKQEHKVAIRKEPRKPSNKGEKRPKSINQNRRHH